MSLYVMILCKVLTYTCSSYRSFSVMWSFFALKLPHLCEWNWHRCLGVSSLYCCFSCYLSSFSYSPFLLIYDPCLHDVIFFLLILLLHSPVSTAFFSFSHCLRLQRRCGSIFSIANWTWLTVPRSWNQTWPIMDKPRTPHWHVWWAERWFWAIWRRFRFSGNWSVSVIESHCVDPMIQTLMT